MIVHAMPPMLSHGYGNTPNLLEAKAHAWWRQRWRQRRRRRQWRGLRAGAKYAPMPDPTRNERTRLDKWLWAARFYKTRSLAAEEIARGRVSVNEQQAKAAREVHAGDRVRLRQGALTREVEVLGLAQVRGPAPVAQALYRETPESLAAREAAAEQRRLGVEPADGLREGRPTKRDRRQLVDWNRWSASLDDSG
jgi:ribosome-associated heat shock protein Hsp15